jgi:GGDEF domain-containing protein
MPIVSIKRFLETASDEPLRLAVALLIEKLADCAALEGDAQALDDFRAEILGIREGVTPDLPTENVLVLAQAAARAQETYNRRLSKGIEKQGADFHVIIRMLQESLVTIAGEKASSVEELTKIGEQLERSNAFGDIHSLKQHLSSCLTGLRAEIEREKTSSRTLIEKLQTELGGFRGGGVAALSRELDPATRLPRQEDCMTAIRHAIDSGTRCFALVMVINRVQRINARFGRDAGDRMLCRFKEHVEKQFSSSDRLFRWMGPAMVGLLERQEAFELVRAQVRRMLEIPIQENYEIGDRSVLIPISAAWSLTLLNSTAEATDQQIQTFIASQGGRDFV